MVTRLIYSWRKRKSPKKGKESAIGELLRFEARKLIEDDPELMKSAEDAITGKRAEKWFNFVNNVSNKVLLHFWDSLLSNLSGAQFFNMFHSLGSAGAAYTMLAPYFVMFTVFSRDRRFSASVMEHFRIREAGCPENGDQAKIVHFTDTFNEINGVALTSKTSSNWREKRARTSP